MDDSQVIFRKITYPSVDSNRYFISSNGKYVYDTLHNRFMKLYDRKGYLACTLDRVHYSIHRLVAYEYCFKNRNLTLQIDHKDGNKLNNDYTNLEWVTASENTRRAHASGLYNTRGENSSTNKYPEEFIHDICKMFVSGMTNIEIFKKITNKRTVDSCNKDDLSLYSLIFRLRKKQIWPDVVSKYIYDTNIRSLHNTFPGKSNSKYTEDQIRKICKLYISGNSVNEIFHNLYPSVEGISETEETYRKNIIRNIINGKIWRNISVEYFDTPNTPKHHNSYDIDIRYLTKLLESETPRNMILKEFGVKFNGTKDDQLLKRAINRRIDNFNKIKLIDESEDIVLSKKDIVNL